MRRRAHRAVARTACHDDDDDDDASDDDVELWHGETAARLLDSRTNSRARDHSPKAQQAGGKASLTVPDDLAKSLVSAVSVQAGRDERPNTAMTRCTRS